MFNSKEYWEKRYKSGGNSGQGSYGEYCDFKTKIINNFLFNNDISNVLEMGCGDGNQIKEIMYNNYTGYDVSKTAIYLCKEKFKNRKNFSFINSLENIENDYFDLTISLDVLYHLIEKEVYDNYLDVLINKSKKFVIIYSTNFEEASNAKHVLHRKFFPNIVEKYNNLSLMNIIEVPKDFNTKAKFFIFKKF